jgi:hypothetical protein
VPKYLKLVKIAMVQVIGFLEDEKCFNNLNFINFQTPQPINNISRPCVLNVYLTILHVGEFSISIGNCRLEGYANPIWF